MTAICTTPSMKNSTALKAGSYQAIWPSPNSTGLTKVSNSQVWTPTQRSVSSRIGAPGYFGAGVVDTARTGPPAD